MDEKSWTWSWFLCLHIPIHSLGSTWSQTSWSLWLSLTELEHYRTIVWTDNIQFIYTFYMVTRKGRSYSWMEEKKENTKHQLIGITSRCTIWKHFELISEMKHTSDCQCLYKKCQLLWKPFGGKRRRLILSSISTDWWMMSLLHHCLLWQELCSLNGKR